ncbi:hypothetical protein [Serinibacter salmoneus]|uniref:N-acetyltransferase domain-containing protein n=1 Tax=Serinibacter salmoneus TaxID=556530 RepID=A0A2A9D3S1_9MICO|nr:hypothetical protein [Serinibacter salmoneus]PFG21303.1 hypothetical protein ATL40_2930 [Serinibacter salmoneus]
MWWLEAIGWAGSVLVVWSLMQARVLRLRWMNLAGALLATGYNLVIEVWPIVAMNGAIAIIDIYWLIRLYREAHDEQIYEVIEVAPEDAYLGHVLRTHAEDISEFHPDVLTADDGEGGPHARPWCFLVLKGDETVGVVIARAQGEATVAIELDWVRPSYRDFTPGEFVHRSGLFRERGVSQVVWDNPPASSEPYLRQMGFTQSGVGHWVRTA